MATGLSLRGALAAACLVLVAGCGNAPTSPDAGPATADASSPSEAAKPSAEPADPVEAVKPEPLRRGETRMALRIPKSYTPSAPHKVGTDDYRCFLLDPHLTGPTYLTGTYVKPDNRNVVHHVILYRADPGQIAAAKALDARDPGEGWTCFGDSGLPNSGDLDNAPWLGAWAPGATEAVDPKGYGVLLAPGTQIVMQVHYNLLGGPGPDRSATLLRLASGARHLRPLQTMLLPAPVELPCRPTHLDNPLCDRQKSIADVVRRFGPVGNTDNYLYLLCGGHPRESEVSSCTRTITQPTTIRAVAGHMHLLGRSIRIVVDPGTPHAHTVLDIPLWNFDNQGAKPIKPVRLEPGQKVQVTCRHVQWLRDQLPAFKGQPDRYVVWGEGTTDEMCLGILTVTHP
ncbi:MAG: hypothetical protein WAV00_08750 [Nocardioides sp.]